MEEREPVGSDGGRRRGRVCQLRDRRRNEWRAREQRWGEQGEREQGSKERGIKKTFSSVVV